MIQRIQTLFLLIVSGLQFSMFFTKMAYSAEEVVKYRELTPLTVMVVLTFLISFLTIFLYRRRMVQIRFSVINIVLLLGFQALLVIHFVKRPEEAIFSISAVFPVVSAILTFIALRYIARDEAMVRAISRLR